MEGQSSKWVELSKGQNHEVEAANIWYAPNRPYINRHLRSGLNASNYNLRRLPYIWLLLFQNLLVSTTVSLSRIWLNEKMNQGNGYHSSPDPYAGN